MMIARHRLIARIALFSALAYALSWGTAFIPNVNLIFFLVFSAGYLWGLFPGVMVGVVGMGLWTSFNPFGPALIPIAISQMVGAGLSGVVGASFRKGEKKLGSGRRSFVLLCGAALLCTALYYLPVSLVDAWLFQPFWPRFYIGLAWALPSLGANLIIFPLLFAYINRLYEWERLYK